MNYKVIQDFQFTTSEKKIGVLKTGSILTPDPTTDEQYIFKQGNKVFQYDAELIENNPDFFDAIDWRNDLMAEIKKSKLKTPAAMYKVVIGFLESNVLNKNTLIPNDNVTILASACYQSYKKTGEAKFLEPLSDLGFEYNDNDYWKKISKKGD